MERRYMHAGAPRIETRGDGTKVITGHGAVFHRAGTPGSEFALWDGLVERVSPTAFDRALREQQDVRGLFNHDPNIVLGRTASGTMRLSVDSNGLRYEIDYDPQDADHVRLERKLAKGDVSGSSFSFSVVKETYSRGTSGTPDVRTLEDVNLYDVGPVTFPAYEAASAGVRSDGDGADAKASYEAWQRELREREVATRLRILELNS